MARNAKKIVPRLEYPFDDFAKDFEAQIHVRDYEYITRGTEEVEVGDDKSFITNVLRAWDYFKQVYPEDVAMERGSLFMVILSHVAENMEKYNVGTLAVEGSAESGSMVSERLLRALHYYFTTRPLSEIKKDDTTITAVKNLAEIKFKDYK